MISHIYDLVTTSNRILGGENQGKIEKKSITQTRESTLILIAKLSTHLKLMTDIDLINLELQNKYTDRQFPLMYLLNGQLADALTHVGQITSWRRISGNPQPEGVNVFLGVKK